MGIYDYGLEQGTAAATAGVMGFMLVFLIVFYLIMLGFLILTYVLQSLGMYTIAKRRGIHHSWLSWVPVGNMWVLGSISDQYQYVVKGRVRNRRKILMGLSIALYALLAVIYIGAIAAVVGGSLMDESWGAIIGSGLAVVLLAYLALIVLAIVAAVFQYIALYDLFASCDPGNAVLYLVLSIFVNVTLPFFMFACRKKDLGMIQKQPRYQPAPQQIPEPAAEPVQETQEESREQLV